jgi:hypothetical protein
MAVHVFHRTVVRMYLTFVSESGTHTAYILSHIFKLLCNWLDRPVSPLRLLVSSAVVFCGRASATGVLQSSPQAPLQEVGPAFSLRLDRWPWSSSRRSYPPPPVVFPAAPRRLYYTEPRLRRCLPLYKGLNAVASRGDAMVLPP